MEGMTMRNHEENFDAMLNVQAVPQDERAAAFVLESRLNRDKCYDFSAKMTEAVATDGKAFRQYLDLQSHFDRYTANNVLLIMAQNPEATKLGDYKYWKGQKAYIAKVEYDNPILIMEPGKPYEREDGSTGTYYNAKKVYDISQTSLGENEESAPTITDKLLVRAITSNPPAAIVATDPDQMPEGRGAVFAPEEKCIYVRKGMSAGEIFRCLAPELVHAGFADGDPEYQRNSDMFHAYAATYMLCKKYGQDTSRFHFENAPDYFAGMEPQEVRDVLNKSRKAFSDISARMAQVIEPSRSVVRRQQQQTREEAR